MADPKSNRPIFIVGCARSGTTLLQLLLHSHPRIAIPPETRFVVDTYQRRHRFGDLTKRENRETLASWIVDRPESKFHDLGLDKEKIRRLILDGPPTLGSASAIVLREYAHAHGKARWGDKRPNNVRFIPQLLRMFPTAQFVHLVRDGRDCVASLKRMPWWKHGYAASVEKWIQAMEAGEWGVRALPRDQFFEIRYEDVCADPEAEMRKLCAFLGEDFDPAMLNHEEAAKDAVPDYKMEWHDRTRQKIDTSAVGKWMKGLSPEEIALMEAMAGDHLRKRGYAPHPSPPPLPVSLRMKYYGHLASQRYWRTRKALRSMRKTAGQDVRIASEVE